MAVLGKKVLAQYIRTGCKRQLALNLIPDTVANRAARDALGMPPKQPPRPGLEQYAQEGERWQEEKIEDLAKAFGSSAVLGDSYRNTKGQLRYRAAPLKEWLQQATTSTFLVEMQFEVTGGSMMSALEIDQYPDGLNLTLSALRPDIIEVLPPGTFTDTQEVLATGERVPLSANDDRSQLRIIDIKLTAEPSPGYFAEVVYYSMGLAAWLVDQGQDADFVVVADPAVWPGSHDASQLSQTRHQITRDGGQPEFADLWAALQEDLERAPFDVFVSRIRQFFSEELLEVLAQDWQALPWHVDNRCSHCDFLGYPWLRSDGTRTDDPRHCMPVAAAEDHLSRVAFVTRGSGQALRDVGINDVGSLASQQPTNAVFDTHHQLRATRTVVAGRANSLQEESASIPEQGGTSAVLPKWVDLHIYLTIDFDIGSAITFAIGLQAFWLEPRDFENQQNLSLPPRQQKRWGPDLYIADRKDPDREREELLALLSRINEILTDPLVSDPDNPATFQIYLWDSLQQQHFARIIGRHLASILNDGTLSHLAWLFPPEEVVPVVQQGYSRRGKRWNPITVVRNVVRAVLAAPIPHYYTLLDVARNYHPVNVDESFAELAVHPLFEYALSDQIPSERAHEIWTRATRPRHWYEQQKSLERTVRTRLAALQMVTGRLEQDLRPSLKRMAAPPVIGPPERTSRVSWDGQLWYAFARLNAAMDELEVNETRAMPPHEREARFRSARLTHRLQAAEEEEAFAVLGLQPGDGRRVYRLAEASREVKVRKGDFNFALAPEADVDFLDRSIWLLRQDHPFLLQEDPPPWVKHCQGLTQVTVLEIDRDRRLLAIEPSYQDWEILDRLEASGAAELSQQVTLDPVAADFFTSKLRKTLHAIGNPDIARDDPLVRRATGMTARRQGRTTAQTPAAEFIWQAPALAGTIVDRQIGEARAELEAHELNLNEPQWLAWEQALTRRLQLIWGPPGTGKTRTLRSVVLGAVLEAALQDRPLRILISALTYNAIDNLLSGVLTGFEALEDVLPADAFQIHRIRSLHQPEDPSIPSEIDRQLDKNDPSPEIRQLIERLQEAEGVTIVASTPQQTHNLSLVDGGASQQELFDLILIDEASQIDVAHAILVFAVAADNGSLVVAGDPKQLPPIHQAAPPLDLEAMVGSAYDFFKEFHGINDAPLTLNYRSNETIVSFARSGGYPQELASYSPSLSIELEASDLAFGSGPPVDWPSELHWAPSLVDLLDPSSPAACFVYSEGRSSQWNQFEADTVAALSWILYGRLGNRLRNHTDFQEADQEPLSPYGLENFWTSGVGIVTPHRAQQALIVGRLQSLFSALDPPSDLIRGAVDTVERFQGQERDVIIGSYALGDTDAIRDEDEFLMSLNRFNVMVSRARAKMILLISKEVVAHLARDLEVLRESSLLKNFVTLFCSDRSEASLGFIDGDSLIMRQGEIRRRRA